MQNRRLVAPVVVLGVASASVAIDQITKSVAEQSLADGPVQLAFGARFVLAYNSGAAFSVGAGRGGVFTVLGSVVVLGLTAYALASRQSVARAVMFGFIIGGASGNLFDRLFRDNGGRVIDFMEATSWWPVFNIADVSLFIGIVLMLIITFREEREARAGDG